MGFGRVSLQKQLYKYPATFFFFVVLLFYFFLGDYRAADFNGL